MVTVELSFDRGCIKDLRDSTLSLVHTPCPAQGILLLWAELPHESARHVFLLCVLCRVAGGCLNLRMTPEIKCSIVLCVPTFSASAEDLHLQVRGLTRAVA